MIRYVKSPAASSRTPGRSGLISFSVHVVADDRLEPVAEELGVEADLERLAGVGRRHRLLRLADVLGLRRDGQLAFGEAQAQRRVALRHHRGAADDVRELRLRQRQLDLERLGQQLPVVRELAVDPARRQPGVAGAEHDVVLVHAELDRVAAGEPRELVSARAGMIASSSGAASPSSRLLHGEPVRVGRGHHELAGLEADEDAGQHRARLVARGRARDPVDRLEQRLAVDLVQLRVDGRQPREVLGGVDVQPRAVRAGDDLTGLLGPVLDRDLALGQRRARSRSSLPGTTTAPSPSTSASSVVRSESSMSVAASESRPPSARSRTPEST